MVRVHFFPFDVSLSNDRVLQFLNSFQQLRWWSAGESIAGSQARRN